MIDMHSFEKGHANKIMEFVEISHELMNLERPLVMTGNHLLFVQRHDESGEQSFVLERADAVQPGDAVLSLDPASKQTRVSKVTGKRWVKARGVFAPQTTSGRLFVEGVAVSCLPLRTVFGAPPGKGRGICPREGVAGQSG